jgi:amidase/aspartyl-tRNA(Asn)/glutamyl-tRNA(Gln) amidotransferase subunit A
VELVDATLERIHQRNGSITAFVTFEEEYARAQAKEIERRLLAGEDTEPLMGIPTAIKDLGESRPGWRGTLGGIRALKDHVVEGYCKFSESMETCGAIPVGKTNSPTFGFRGTCDNYLWGPTRNPFDLTKNSGGSSGGSAAAVADGLVPFAEGTDGGGSIRIPAAWTNLYGFKGTMGRLARLSRPSVFSATTLFTFEGALSRGVEDTALVMEAMSGHDPRDPMSLADHVDWQGALNGSVQGWKVAYSPDFGVFPVDARVKALCREAAQAFEAAGAHVEEVKVPLDASVEALGDLWCRLQIPGSIVQIERLRQRGIDLMGEHRADLPPELVYWAEYVLGQNVNDVAADNELRTRVYDAVQSVFETHDLLLTPTLACPPVDNATDGNTMGPGQIDGVPLNRLIGWCLTFFLNFTGHPAASVPAGLIDGRLPTGLQIIGRKFADADVITASAVYEQVRPWKQHYALCAERPL